MSKVLVILAMCQPCRSFVPPAATTIVRQSDPVSIAEPCSRPTAVLLQSKETQDDDLFWDGEVIEGAHDMEFESIADAEDAFVPSAGFLSMAQSVQSPAMTAAFDPYRNAGKIHQLSMESDGLSIDDLEEMGGDPAFLDDPEEDEPKGNEEEGDFFWDGEVNEDAWLD
ncbi:hypothetical protein THAOC_18611 [Thalassiosira oceanica]|uniref:Uncharacterized protein n=1 Tax=Thalassiosira oceanica TaxID=159749 RepID=K0SIW5_THAOC|nr:hypothetical protein THAOC_18611 [Thalassiosira oceanica]|mmetsp:Transcript_20407/g.47929  ORF Transcript_20407/g.47929 Transcript_20407/m.47929 type:complete len:168 (+) Transcript_20407:321-824(+)|eukprot:EJK60966.1 hypothetical protein THAOC_18611 [Thalassiosira oceanica]